MVKHKQDIYEAAKSERELYSHTGNKHFKEKAEKYYDEYKKMGGKKKLK
jgi:hypothetical protein